MNEFEKILKQKLQNSKPQVQQERLDLNESCIHSLHLHWQKPLRKNFYDLAVVEEQTCPLPEWVESLSPIAKEAYRFFFERGEEPRLKAKDIKLCFHNLAIRLHPDQGGSHHDFILLNQNYEILLSMVEKEAA